MDAIDLLIFPSSLIALEEERDFLPDLLQAIPPQKRLLYWYGLATDGHGLRQRYQQLFTVATRLYALVLRVAPRRLAHAVLGWEAEACDAVTVGA